MESRGIIANDYTYQAVASCCHSKVEATQLLTIIKEKSHSPNEFVWGTLCGVAAKRQDYNYLLYLIKVIITNVIKASWQSVVSLGNGRHGLSS